MWQNVPVVEAAHALAGGDPLWAGNLTSREVRIVKVRMHASSQMDGHVDRIDPERWRALIMSVARGDAASA